MAAGKWDYGKVLILLLSKLCCKEHGHITRFCGRDCLLQFIYFSCAIVLYRYITHPHSIVYKLQI